MRKADYNMDQESRCVQGSLAYGWSGRRTVDAPSAWRHAGAMVESSVPSRVAELDRLNLRLSPDTFAAIDAVRADRPGSVSRNTWIAEAVQEKLARSREAGVAPPRDALRHA